MLIDKSKHSVGIIARLVPVKNHNRFIDAAEYLLADYPDDYEFHIVGDGPEYERLQTRIRQSNHFEKIHLHGFQESVAAIISRLSAIVFTSDHEGTPMAALEAASLGIPIVTVPIPSVEDVIRSGAAGMICSGFEPAVIANAIRTYLSEATAAKTISPSDWRYSATRMATDYLDLYQTVIRGH